MGARGGVAGSQKREGGWTWEEREKRVKGEKEEEGEERRGGASWDSAPGCRQGWQPLHPPVHDALEDGSKGGDADACPDEYRVLGGKDPAGGGSVRAIDVAL